MIARREALAGAGAIAAAMALPTALTARTSHLVLVHCASEADFDGCALLDGANPFWHAAMAEAIAEHEASVRRLESGTARVVHLHDLLAEAVARAKRTGTWNGWLIANHPELGPSDAVTALTLLGRDPIGRAAGYAAPFAIAKPDARQGRVLRFALGDLRATPLADIALLVRPG